MVFKQCACCGQKTLEEGSIHDICPVCGWEDDDIQNDDPNYGGGANDISLNEAKQVFAAGKNIIPYEKETQQKKRKPHEDTGASITAFRLGQTDPALQDSPASPA